MVEYGVGKNSLSHNPQKSINKMKKFSNSNGVVIT